MGLWGSIRGLLFSDRRRPIEVPADRPIRARYDAAQDSTETVNIWSAADDLDADAANSLAVRRKLRRRSRYERANNGDAAGILKTQANYVIGTGPSLRMQTGTQPFNAAIEAAWNTWAKAIGLNRKLRTAIKAKDGDGEAFLQITRNPAIKHRVQMDIQPIECDRITAPVMVADDANYIDGIRFDGDGNAISYDILDRHPGGAWFATSSNGYRTIPAKFVCHWFTDDRPGQHRGVPTAAPTLNLFGTGRRYREAVVAAAETAADFAAVLEMPETNEGPDEVRPFTTLPIEKRMLVATPAGGKLNQYKAEQPATVYEGFIRAMLREEARPFNMPYNIAACDSSGYSFSGGRLDHQTYFVSVWVERQDCEQLVLDRIFAAWLEEAIDVYGWQFPPERIPRHTWDWDGMPQIDDAKTANARKTSLGCGATSLGRVYAEDGLDFEDEIEAMAEEYGISVDEMRAKLLAANFGGAASTPSDDDEPDNDEPEDDEDARRPARGSAQSGNGHHAILGRM